MIQPCEAWVCNAFINTLIMIEKAMVPTDALQTPAVTWQVLQLPEILAIFGLGDDGSEEKCPIWTF